MGGKFRAWASGTRRTGFELPVHYLFAVNISEPRCKVGIKIVLTVQCCSVQFSRPVVSNSFVTPWTAARQASLSITNSRSLLKLMSID